MAHRTFVRNLQKHYEEFITHFAGMVAIKDSIYFNTFPENLRNSKLLRQHWLIFFRRGKSAKWFVNQWELPKLQRKYNRESFWTESFLLVVCALQFFSQWYCAKSLLKFFNAIHPCKIYRPFSLVSLRFLDIARIL